MRSRAPQRGPAPGSGDAGEFGVWEAGRCWSTPSPPSQVTNCPHAGSSPRAAGGPSRVLRHLGMGETRSEAFPGSGRAQPSAFAQGRDGTLLPDHWGAEEGIICRLWGSHPIPPSIPSGQSPTAVTVGPAKKSRSPGPLWPPPLDRESRAETPAGPPCPAVPVPSTPWCPGHHRAPGHRPSLGKGGSPGWEGWV